MNDFSFFEKIKIPLLLTNSSGEVLFANQQCQQLLHIPPQQASFNVFTSLALSEEDREVILQSIDSKGVFYDAMEYENKPSVRYKIQQTTLDEEDCFFFQFFPHTEEELNEDHIREIGQATGKIAHDISNPIAILRIQCDNLKIRSERFDTFQSEDLQKKVEKLKKACHRVTDTNSQLMALAKAMKNYDVVNILNIVQKVPPPLKEE